MLSDEEEINYMMHEQFMWSDDEHNIKFNMKSLNSQHDSEINELDRAQIEEDSMEEQKVNPHQNQQQVPN